LKEQAAEEHKVFDEAEMAEQNHDDQVSIFNEKQTHNEDEPLNIELQTPARTEPDLNQVETSIKPTTPERSGMNIDLLDDEHIRPQTAPVQGSTDQDMQDFTPTAAEVQNDMKMMKMVKKGF